MILWFCIDVRPLFLVFCLLSFKREEKLSCRDINIWILLILSSWYFHSSVKYSKCTKILKIQISIDRSETFTGLISRNIWWSAWVSKKMKNKESYLVSRGGKKKKRKTMILDNECIKLGELIPIMGKGSFWCRSSRFITRHNKSPIKVDDLNWCESFPFIERGCEFLLVSNINSVNKNLLLFDITAIFCR